MAVEQITYKNIDPKVRNMIMVGLSFAMLVACFDGTIVGTCGPVIAEDLNGTSLYSWMVTAYMLCETIMIPISGKLSDLYGRKPLFLIGLTLFVVGSIFAGMSTSMEMLIACRAIQGLGGGILIPVATAAVADLYSPKDRARMQGILGAVFGIGSGIGPLIGGYITEYISWHWIFYINIPMALIAYALTIKKFPTPVYDEKPIIDVKGIAFLSIMLLDILLFFEWAGSKFDWVSAESFVMIAIALAMIVLFVTVERKAAEPILAPHLVHNKTVILACIFMFVFGLAMMGAMMYSSMFAISILGLNTLEAGEYSLALVAGMMITSMLSGNLVNKTGYKFWLIIGPIITALGLYMFSGMTVGTELSYYAICLFVFGIGLGCMMSVIMVAVQNSSEPSEMGMTTSAVNVKEKFAKQTQLMEQPGMAECATALLSGIVDAATTDDIILAGLASASRGRLRVVGKAFTQEYYGIGVKKGNTELKNKINNAITDMIQDGSWQRAISDNTRGVAYTPNAKYNPPVPNGKGNK